ncbi:MAG TPA: GDP-mannose 4,6-dehydratase [Gemmatimonadaceae bacterium]|nr:GDP-mannose 4,6-dehydratase [Gemmatimonadaceae bacterium]
MTTALITGVSGQDGSYLAELLLEKRYRVVGFTRDADRARQGPLRAVADRIELRTASLGDAEGLARLVAEVQPREIYNLAGQTRVSDSWSDPIGTGDASGLAVTRLLEAVRRAAPDGRFLQASSSEMYAPELETPLREDSAMRPASPYGAAKLYAHHVTRQYREAYGMHVSSAILFNHESPRRSEAFVTRKITRAAARIARGAQRELRLGNLDARRDWGFAGDYVRALWEMLQVERPEDLVIGTGVAHSVSDFCAAAFAAAGLNWRDHVVSDPSLFRSADTPVRLADPTRARERLGWTPEVDFTRLIEMMVRYDMDELRLAADS